MKVIPELDRSREFGTLGMVAMYQLDQDLCMVECSVELDYDLDGNGRSRSCRSFWNYDGALDEFESVKDPDDLFCKLGLSYPEYVKGLNYWGV